jgi:hypothetical protein
VCITDFQRCKISVGEVQVRFGTRTVNQGLPRACRPMKTLGTSAILFTRAPTGAPFDTNWMWCGIYVDRVQTKNRSVNNSQPITRELVWQESKPRSRIWFLFELLRFVERLMLEAGGSLWFHMINCSLRLTFQCYAQSTRSMINLNTHVFRHHFRPLKSTALFTTNPSIYSSILVTLQILWHFLCVFCIRVAVVFHLFWFSASVR